MCSTRNHAKRQKVRPGKEIDHNEPQKTSSTVWRMNRETSVHRFGKIENEKPQRVGSALEEEDLRISIATKTTQSQKLG